MDLFGVKLRNSPTLLVIVDNKKCKLLSAFTI